MPPDRNEMLDRLKLIETMMAEGRRSTQRWGWVFLLWGIGPLIAMLWAAHGPHPEWAWPAIMGLCIIVNGLVVRARKRHGESKTTTMRSVGAVWTCAGATVLLVALAAAWSGMSDFRYLYVMLFALAAVAHATSSLILRWPTQFFVALLWWLASALAFVVPAGRLSELAALALLLGNIVFGAWLTYREWSRKDG